MIDKNYWQGKRVFVTGYTGFKGSWLSLWLSEMGAIVKGYALEAQTVPSLFEIFRLSDFMDYHMGYIRDFEKRRIC
ncbi:CDP-glucose 4,6-dehydratase, partial [Salmonella enterica subsp. enterica serovar Enteritidis]|nr:CDP-glucose 4,6-dehydratase [Salmonella enterica subsp. enterica serovar Enteritidis]